MVSQINIDPKILIKLELVSRIKLETASQIKYALVIQIELEPATSAKLPMPMTGIVLDNRRGNEQVVNVLAECSGEMWRCTGL